MSYWSYKFYLSYFLRSYFSRLGRSLFICLTVLSLLIGSIPAQAFSPLPHAPSFNLPSVSSAQDFSWGALAMNTDKAIYQVGEPVNVAMAALDEKGNMACNSRLALLIQKQGDNKSATLSTDNGGLAVNPECQEKNYTTRPDFTARVFAFAAAGEYSLTLTAVNKNGARSIVSHLSVGDAPPFNIQRQAPTRVYPAADYPVTINIIARDNFQGTVEEPLPDVFNIVGQPKNSAADLAALQSIAAGDYRTAPSGINIKTHDNKKIISFPVNLKAGQSTTLSYIFHAPNVSPEFYTLGPLNFYTVNRSNRTYTAYTEPRAWQLANDTVAVKAGNFTKKTSTGSQSITGLGFQPKAIIFYWTGQTTGNSTYQGGVTDGSGAGHLSNIGMGFATQTGTATSSEAVSYCSDSQGTNGTTDDSAVRITSTSTIMIMDGAGQTTACNTALDGRASVTTMDADGFTLNWTTANASSTIIYYYALGGSDVTNATTSTFTVTTSSGNQSVTGLGFAPDLVFYLGANTQTYDGNITEGRMGFGFSTVATSTEQAGIGFAAVNNGATAGTAVMQGISSSTILHATGDGTSNTPPPVDASFITQSLDSNGFTIKNAEPPTANMDMFYLAIKGPQVKVGSFDSKTTTGTQAITGVGFQPQGLFMFSDGFASSTVLNQTNAALSLGAVGWATTTNTSATTSYGSVGYADLSGDTLADPSYITSTTTLIQSLTDNNGSAPTVNASGTLSSFDSNGFTMNWPVTVNATGRQILYWAVGNSPNISGHVYSDEGKTGLVSSATIKLTVSNLSGTASTTYSTTTVAGSGQYDFFNIPRGPSNILTVYLSGVSPQAVVVDQASSTPIGNLTGLDLYQNDLILRADDGNALTNTDISYMDGDNDANINFTSNNGSLIVNSGYNIYLWASDSFAPGGLVTTQGSGNFHLATSSTATLATTGNAISGNINLDDASTLNLNATTTVSGGSITTTGSGLVTYTANTPTVTLNGTGTLGGGTSVMTFYNLASTGGGTINVSAPLTINGTLTPGPGTWNYNNTSGTVSVPFASYNNLGFLPGSGTPTFQLNNPNAVNSWYDTSYAFRKAITINHNYIASATTETYPNFPVLVNLASDDSLYANAQQSGNDILFTSSDKLTKLNYEIEKYATSTAATSSLVAWVKLPSLSTSTDTTIYMYYGSSTAASMATTTGVWDSNYKGIWHIGEGGSAATTTESTSDGYNAGLRNNPTWVTGKIGNALQFNGSNTYLDAGLSANIGSLTNNVTFSAWINPSSTSTYGAVIWPARTNSSNGLGLSTASGTKFTTVSIKDYISTNNTISTGNWYYLTAIMDGSNNTSFYLNGGFTDTVTGTTPGTANNDDDLYIGANTLALSSTLSNIFNGTIDEVRVSNTNRSADWIKTEYNNQNSPATFETVGAPEPEAWYNSSWSYRKAITIDHTKVASTVNEGYANFPVLVNLASDANLYASAQASGNDILFTQADGATKLNHELEKYTVNSSAATSSLVAWVNVGSSGLSTSSDITLYMYYGNSGAASQATTTGTWNSNYQAVWHLSETSGSQNDSTNNGVNSSLISVTTQGSAVGQIGGTDVFASSSKSNITFPVASSPSVSGNLTVSAWVKPNNENPINIFRTIINKEITGTNRNYCLVIWDHGANAACPDRVAVFDYSTGGVSKAICGATAVADGNWHHIAGVFNAGTSALVYVDGNQDGSTTTPGSSLDTQTATTTLGAENNGALSRYFDGSIDEVEIASTNQSADWIKTEYNNQNSPSTFYSLGSAGTKPGTAAASPMTVSGNLTIGDGTHAAALDASTNGLAVSVGGSLTIATSSSFTALAASNLTVGGNLTINGTLTHTNGTLVLNTGAPALIASTTFAFNNITVAAPGKTLKFQAGATYAIAGAFSVTGFDSAPVNIQSTTAGSQWLVNFSLPQTAVTFTRLTDSGCFAGTAVVTNTDSDSSGGNNGACWVLITHSGGGGGGHGGPLATPAVDNGQGNGPLTSGGANGSGSGGGSTPPTNGGGGNGSLQTGGGNGNGGAGASP